MSLFKALLTSLSLVLLLGTTANAADCPAAGSLTYNIALNGSQFGGQGSPVGSGSGYLTIDPLTNQATIHLDTAGLTGITGAGIYSGSSTTPVLSLTDANNTFENGMLDRTITLTPQLMSAIMANPSSYSFGVTTNDYPNGAVSGSLMMMQSFTGAFSGTSVVGGTGATTGGGSFTGSLTAIPSGTGNVLTYTFTPSGIGNSITGLELRQGTSGSNGTLVASLSGANTLTNGSITGTTALTNSVAQQLMTNPGNFYIVANTSQYSTGAIRAQVASVMNELFFPVTGSVAGAGDAHWETDIQIFNASWSSPATVTMHFLPTGQANATTSGTMSSGTVAVVTIPPRGTSNFTGAMQQLFNLSSSLGTLHLISDQPIVASARIYNDQRSSGRGTSGQSIPAMTRCDAVARGILAGLSGTTAGGNATPGSAGTAMRTNIGFFNPNSTAVTVNFNLGSETGASIGTRTITLQPFMHMQMPLSGSTGLFANQSASTSAGTATFQASAPIFAYASLIDNTSGDTSFVKAQEDPAATPMSESDIAAVVVAANQGEVQVNSAELPRLITPDARAFAQAMITEHNAALAESQTVFTQNFITPTENAMSAFLRTMSSNTIATLAQTSPTINLDRAFIQSQVDMHQLVLNNLEQVLIPSARTPQLRALLMAQRDEVAQHLATARQLLATL
jgi:putative membrane protein